MAGLLWSVVATIVVASVLLVVLRHRASWFATSVALTSGIAAGQLAWIASNDYLAAGRRCELAIRSFGDNGNFAGSARSIGLAGPDSFGRSDLGVDRERHGKGRASRAG